jgi:AcrR family transcriptional regulator
MEQRRQPARGRRQPTRDGRARDGRRPARQPRAPGERSRRRILEQAARLATVEGLEGLSIGRLAEASGMPKSSVYVLFGSKEELQLATIEAARASFVEEVVTPVVEAGWPGRERLGALCEGYLGYVQRRVFPGGCFFVATAAELGARPGRVHDLVATYQREWRDLLEQTAREASQAGELDSDSDPAQLAFELTTLLAGTNIVTVLHDDDAAIDHARRAVAARLSTGLGGGPSVANWTRPGSRAEGGA